MGLPESLYVPGMGLFLGLLLVFAVGLVMRAWEHMPKLPARPSFVVATSHDRQKVADAVWKLVEDNLVPVHKFNHRWPAGTDISGTPLARLTGLETL